MTATRLNSGACKLYTVDQPSCMCNSPGVSRQHPWIHSVSFVECSDSLRSVFTGPIQL